MTHASTRRTPNPLLVSRNELVDIGFLLILGFVALFGFRSTYSGWEFLIAGGAGVVLGLLVAHLACATPKPLLAAGVLTVAAFFLLGGAAALRGTALFGVLPTGRTFSGLGGASTHGWKDLLTTLPPVDGHGPLLVLPYLLGLLTGVSGLVLARLTTAAWAPVVAPILLLAVVIVLGTRSPAALTVQGVGFGVLTCAWFAVRSQRIRPQAATGSGRLARLGTAAALLVISGVGAVLLAPHAPGYGGHRRLVLRNYVEPPFNVGQYPSPLAGLRKYVNTASGSLRNQELFTVSGLPKGASVRIATMDSYDGSVWAASGDAQAGQLPGDTFQRVGTTITNPAPGTPVSFEVTLAGGYSDVWLPDAGAVTSVEFHGRQAGPEAKSFRYNLATNTGIVPQRLSGGDRYTVHATVDPNANLSGADSLSSTGALPETTTSFLKSQAGQWSGDSNSPAARIEHLAAYLRANGRFSDGNAGQSQYLPGHSIYRLTSFVNGVQIVGDDEQYAAALALMINQLGVPARVVFGAHPENGTVFGRDVEAWVEVERADGRWATIPTSEFVPTRAPDKNPPQPQAQPNAGQFVPPPATVRPRSTLDDADLAGTTSIHNPINPTPPPHGGGGLPGFVVAALVWGGPPVALVALVLGGIVGFKAWRRQRRRSRGSAAVRFARGWHEILDHARDLGTIVPDRRTRREQAAALPGTDQLAAMADSAIFGPAEPDEAQLSSYWQEISRTRKQMSSSVGRFRRFRAAVSLSSLRIRRAI